MASIEEAGSSKRSFAVWRIVAVTVPLAIACVLVVQLTASRIVEQAQKKSEETMLNWFELTSPTPRRLEPQFKDADNDLVADLPAEADKHLLPDSLVFSYVAGPDAENELSTWQDFVTFLTERVGRPVKAVAFASSNEQLGEMAAGKLHVAGINTGAVPAAVASCGFVPVCTLGHDDGTFGITMQLIVPASSPVKKIEDLKGQAIAFTTRDSNSGCKAALALLQDHDMLPLRDYLWKFSGGHEESIRGVAEKRYAAASVASDLLQRARNSGAVEPESVRVIYESERFPPATIGYVYDLGPDLTAKIRQAFLEFDRKGTTLEKQFDASGSTKFVPVSYKQDFALIRRIDDAFHKPATTASK